MTKQRKTIGSRMDHVPASRPSITLVSGHYPLTVDWARKTRASIGKYASKHCYNFYYEEESPTEVEVRHLHYRRCMILQRAASAFPDCDWFVWIDTDIFVNDDSISIESQIDLAEPGILYHLFHERPWTCQVNTGVKIVHRDGLAYEDEIYQLRV